MPEFILLPAVTALIVASPFALLHLRAVRRRKREFLAAMQDCEELLAETDPSS